MKIPVGVTFLLNMVLGYLALGLIGFVIAMSW